jgi:hypothetical protein
MALQVCPSERYPRVSPTFMIDGMVQADISGGDAVADWASRLLKS